MKAKFRIGDKVRIIKPYVFVRCGYNMTLEDAIKEIPETHIQTIDKIIYSLNPSEYEIFDLNQINAIDDIKRVLGRLILKKKNYGGKERSIHTMHRSDLSGKVLEVIGKSYCKTGIYNHGYICYDGEFSAPYLANEKTHVILDVADYVENEHIRIEQENVEKV